MVVWSLQAAAESPETRVEARAPLSPAAQEREDLCTAQRRIIWKDGLVCGFIRGHCRSRSPLRRRWGAGVLKPEVFGEVAPAGAYIRRYLLGSVRRPESEDEGIDLD